MLEDLWQNLSILLVDDSATSRALLVALLKGLPVQITQARSAQELQTLPSHQPVDLVLLDVRLPDGDGVELLNSVRERFPRATIVLVTGKADLATATGALVRGADGYLDKRHLKEGPQAFRQALEHAMLHRARVRDQAELQHLKEEFLSVIAHDLRSPAASARVALTMYRQEPDEQLLEIAERNLDRLFLRLDRYLDFQRMEALSWRMDAEPHDLLDVITDVLTALNPLVLSQGRTLEWQPTDAPIVLEMDRLWLAQAVENLVANALKHTPPTSVVRVLAGVTPSHAWVEVSDQGPGVAAPLVAGLFERFSRGSAKSRGQGLGLSIVRNVVEAHGGSVEYIDSAGPGATFRITFPKERSLQNL